MRTMINGSFDPTSSWCPPDGGEARIRLKTQHLLQDFEELVMDTKATKDKLEKAKRKKRVLKSQVKFLRRKYENFIKNQPEKLYLGPSNTTSKYHQSQSTDDLFFHRAPNTGSRLESKLKEKNSRPKKTPLPNAAASVDLNRTIVPNGVEVEAEAVSGMRRMEKALGSDPNVKPLVRRDAGKRAAEVGKRKISWQDPLALWAEG